MAPEEVEADPGTTAQFSATVELYACGEVEGWSLSIVSERCTITAANTSGLGFTPTFESTTLASNGAGAEGALSGVLLSPLSPARYDLLNLTVEAPVGAECQSCSLKFVDNVFSFQPGSPLIENRVLSSGQSFAPSPIDSDILVCPAQVDTDGDGTFDPDDNCPFDFNPTQADILPGETVDVPVLFALDIKPGSCPNSLAVSPTFDGKGVVSVAILGSDLWAAETVDPETVDPETVTLAGAPPVRWSIEDAATPLPEGADEFCECHDLRGDGWDDLVLKFNRSDLEIALQSQLGDFLPLLGLTVPLSLGGETVDGLKVAGEDCLRLVLKGDANKDGRLDLSDILTILTELFVEAGGVLDSETADVNGDGLVDVSDATWLMEHLF